MPDEFFTPGELAARWHCRVGTLAKARCYGRGPAYTKVEGKVLYPKGAVYRYERANTRRPRSERVATQPEG